jgi:DNA segregation ATPase FtsK/SpoIIIE-like protein
MAKKKTAGGGRSTSKSDQKSRKTTRKSRKRPTIKKRASRLERIRSWLAAARDAFKTLTDPKFWERIAEKLPPWADEIGALLLIVLGVVALTALFNTSSEAALSVTLSDVLRQIFGHGAYLAALGVLVTGVILLLPKFGLTIRVGWVRAASIEIAFGAFLALLHLFANDPEPRALAREGGGGGFLGWSLTYLTSSLGDTLSMVLYGALCAGGVVMATGLRRAHVVLAAAWLNDQLQNSISRLETMTFEADEDEFDEVEIEAEEDDVIIDTPSPPTRSNPSPTTASAKPAASSKTQSTSKKDNPGSDKPGDRAEDSASSKTSNAKTPSKSSKKSTSEAQSTSESKSTSESTSKSRSKSKSRRMTKQQRREIVDETRRSMGASNGRSLVAPGEPGERSSVVPREYLPGAKVVPAAPKARQRQIGNRIERYFTVDDFTEVKKVGKRSSILPPLELLNDIELNKPTEEEINTNAKIIKHTLLEFDVETDVIDVKVGPTVTQYAVSPYTETVNDKGETVLHRVRVSKIANLNSDLALALSAKRLRIQAPVPGHSYVGVEVPNRQPSTVALRPVLESEHFYKYRKRPLALPLGRDVSGEPFVADLQTMPHLLVAGTTGSGKSIMLASLTTAFVTNNPPERVKLVLLDPKMVELNRFNGLPHLLGPVETELDRIIGVLRWVTREMDLRYKLLEKEAARNLESYNQSLGRRRKDEHLPYIVVMIDEIGDLMMQRPEETERALTRLAQMARAVGIHLIVATQRPSVDVITGLIKANFPARISFAVASGTDSRVILDYNGAETLMGRGDMLFLAPDASGPRRIQGCYVSDEEVNDVVEHWKQWHEKEIKAGNMEPPAVAPWERGMTRREVLAETDPMLEEAIELVVEEGEASASLIQRRLGLGYPRAARLMDLMQELGVVGTSRSGGRTREVLVKPGADPFKRLVEKRMKNK